MLYVLKCIKYITFYENSHSERERLYYYRFNANLFLRNKNCIKRVENYFPFYKIGVFCELFYFLILIYFLVIMKANTYF